MELHSFVLDMPHSPTNAQASPRIATMARGDGEAMRDEAELAGYCGRFHVVGTFQVSQGISLT